MSGPSLSLSNDTALDFLEAEWLLYINGTPKGPFNTLAMKGGGEEEGLMMMLMHDNDDE